MHNVKIKYKPTLLNIASILLIVFDNYRYWISDVSGEVNNWGFIALILSFGIGFLGLLIDFGLQRFLKNYWIISGVELVFLLVFVTLYLWNTREKTIILPNNFEDYITVVYGVEGTKPLLTNTTLNFGYTVEIPEKGILFTETALMDDIWNTKFQTKSGVILENIKNNTIINSSNYKVGQFNCKGNNWEYRTWRVNYNKSVITTNNLDTITIKKIEDYCNVNY